MSIYSGFANRQLESNYNRLVEGTLHILQSRILKFYQEFEENDTNFIKLLSKNVNYLSIMEKSKYLPPKFSECLKDICIFLKIQINQNEQSHLSYNLNSSQQGSLQRNSSFNNMSNCNSPIQQNMYNKRSISPINNHNKPIKCSLSPIQQRSTSTDRNIQIIQKLNISPNKNDLKNQFKQLKTQSNMNSLSPVRSYKGILNTENQNSCSTLHKDNSRSYLSGLTSNNTSSLAQNKVYSSYLTIEEQPNKQISNNIFSKRNMSHSPNNSFSIQCFSKDKVYNKDKNHLQQTNSSSLRNSKSTQQNTDQSRSSKYTNYNNITIDQINDSIYEGNSQNCESNKNEQRTISSVQERNFRMKILNKSPNSKDINQNQIQITNKSKQIQRGIQNQNHVGLTKNQNTQFTKHNILHKLQLLQYDKQNQEQEQNQNYNPGIQQNNSRRNSIYMKKQKILQGIENYNDYGIIDETINQMKKQVQIQCQSSKSQVTPSVISPIQKPILKNDNKLQTQALLRQLIPQNELYQSQIQELGIIQTRSYSFHKNSPSNSFYQ